MRPAGGSRPRQWVQRRGRWARIRWSWKAPPARRSEAWASSSLPSPSSSRLARTFSRTSRGTLKSEGPRSSSSNASQRLARLLDALLAIVARPQRVGECEGGSGELLREQPGLRVGGRRYAAARTQPQAAAAIGPRASPCSRPRTSRKRISRTASSSQRLSVARRSPSFRVTRVTRCSSGCASITSCSR